MKDDSRDEIDATGVLNDQPYRKSYKPIQSRYSPIAPIALLENLYYHDKLGDYLLVLAHDVIANYDRYQDLLTAVKRRSPDAFIILDNSAVELGEAILPSNPDYIRIANKLPLDCFVLPDVIGDFGATQRLVTSQLPFIYNEIPIPYMRIPQGRNNHELVACAQWYQDMLEPNVHAQYGELWSVPRWVANKIGSRIPMVQYINASVKGQKAIHLLGMSRHFRDDITCTSLPNVIGIDSANPVVLGQKNIFMANYSPSHVPHVDRNSFWNEARTPTVATFDNIKVVRDNIKLSHPGIQPHEGMLV